MTEETLEVAALMALGEDLRARLFPRPKQEYDPATGMKVDGELPYPMPQRIKYVPSPGTELVVTFVRDHTIRRLSEDLDEPGWNSVMVISDVEPPFTVDLSFGTQVEDRASSELTALLRAIAGASIVVEEPQGRYYVAKDGRGSPYLTRDPRDAECGPFSREDALARLDAME